MQCKTLLKLYYVTVHESPSVVLSTGKTMRTERFLSFEPYTEIEPLTLQELWDKNEEKVISDD